MKRTNKMHLMAIAAVLVPVFIIGTIAVFDPDDDVSKEENRNLAAQPAFSLSDYFSGKYISNYEKYYNDQFPARGMFININRFFSKLFSGGGGNDDIFIAEKPDNGGGAGEALNDVETTIVSTTQGATTTTSRPTAPPVAEEGNLAEKNYVIIKGDRAMELYSNNYSKLKAYAESINKLKSDLPNTKVYCMLAPTSVEFYSPDSYHKPENKSQIYGIQTVYDRLKNVTGINAYDAIVPHINEYVYFRTDHHWTARGAYYAYTAFAKQAGFKPADISKMHTGKIDGFIGSLYRYTKGLSQSDRLKKNPDFVEYFEPLTTVEGKYYQKSDLSNGISVNVINKEISADNKYLCFIAGDNPVTKFTTSEKNGKSILVIKESYGNAFVPYLCNNYENVYVIDPRKVNLNLSNFVKTNEIDEVLCLNYMFAPSNSTFMNAFNKMI